MRKKSNRARFNKDIETPTSSLNMEFEDVIQFREAIIKYYIARRVKIKFVKNKPTRLELDAMKNIFL